MTDSAPEDPSLDDQEALSRYDAAKAAGLSDAEAREEGWPTAMAGRYHYSRGVRHPLIPLRIARAADVPDIELPAYQTEGAAGLDLAAIEKTYLHPGDTNKIRTGIHIEIPEGFLGLITPRSGLAYKHGVTILNTPGTIDSDYRGELRVIVINLGQKGFTITRGMRIAQLVITPIVQVAWTLVGELPSSARGEGGFGHTGE